ncbi:MAG: DNA-binding protein [Lachnospiraceae bacterium]|nr:DNA-binding protein [Lachnospiraceae bacterium]
MKTFCGKEFGRYLIIGMQKGDDILACVRQAIGEYGVKNAIVTSGIAATYHMRWHHIKDTADLPTDEFLEQGGPIEVGGISGMVIDGVPHLHCNFADHDRAWSGHLEDGCLVQYVGEISMIELLDLDITRLPNEFGVKLLSERES